jgi:taurine transport system permease protein
MTGQAKNTAYELSNTAEFAQIDPKKSASRRNAIGDFLARHRSLVLSLSSVISVLVIWYLITALKIVPSLFLPAHKRYGRSFLKSVNKAL